MTHPTALEYVRSLAEDHAEAILEVAPSMELAELAQALVDLDRATAALANVKKSLTREIAARTGTGDHMTEVGLLEVKPKVTRKEWQHADVGSKLLSVAPTCAQLDRTTGAVESIEQTVMRLILAHAGIGYWKQSLKQVGIRADDYCVKEDDGYSVYVRGAK